MLDVTSQFDPFAGPELDCVVYTTKAQSEIWTACYFGGKDATRAYNESISLDFTGSLDVDSMDQAIQKLLERHESLRATFSTDGVYMSIFKEMIIEITKVDISNLEEIHKQDTIDQYIKEDINFLFDLVQGPLIKVGLLKISDKDHKLVITVHHIICDGWSIGIILQDLGAIYSALVSHELPDLPIPLRFSDYANEEQLFSKSDENKKSERFWYKMYENSIPVLNVPTDYPRPLIRTYKSQRLDFALDANLLSNLKQTGLSSGASLVSTLLTSFEVFLCQLTGQDDIVIGLPYAGQPVNGMNHLIGHCVNLLPLRSKPLPEMSFSAYLKQRKSELFDAYDHSKLTFGRLLQTLNISRDASRIPLVPIAFNIDLGMIDGVHFSNLTYKLISNPRAYEAFEIFVNASGDEKNLVFEWSFNQALFKPETITKMMNSFENIIRKISEDPSKTLQEITFKNFTIEYRQLNETTTSYPHIPLHDLFAQQAKKSPKNIALEFLGNTISYEKLNIQTNQMAHYLKDLGFGRGNIIAVSMPRSPELVISLLAIMQCGSAYLPLDPEYPISRLQFMLEDSDAKFLLTTKDLSASLPKLANTILIEDTIASLKKYPVTKLETQVNHEEVVYLLYTSGSTGNPKGVPITHKNLVNFLCSMALEPGINENDRLLSITTISFDIAALELYLPLIKGATLILADHETARDGRLLLELIKNEKINFLQATPTTWSMLLDSGWSKSLPIKALCGGEAMTADLAKELIFKCDTVWNVYGPTETTIWSSLKQVKADDALISIGKPIANTQFYIINDQGQLVAPGNIGEIAIGGDGVASGYWKSAELTNEKFIRTSLYTTNNNILYRTGDLGKLLPTNEIECLGRIDQQVKIRGQRIEPGEVEEALLLIDGIKFVVVLANENFLIAHIVPNGSIETAENQISSWRDTLNSQLPPHLVPQDFNIIEKMPTTPNGKIDRKALSQYKINKKGNYTYPKTETQKLVAEIWKKCLNIEKVDIYSNFFEIGGHSIVAVKVMNEIEKETGKRLPLSSLFQSSTIEKLAQLLEDKTTIIGWDSLVPIKPNGTKTPLYMVHGAGLNVLTFNALAKNLDEDQPVFGLQAKGLNGIDEPFGTIEEIASYYIDCIMKVNSHGPYALAGYSFGGVIAYEMAHQFKMRGKKVTMIGLLDTDVNTHSCYANPTRKMIEKITSKFKNDVWVLSKMLTDRNQAKERINTQVKKIKNFLLELKHGKEKQYQVNHQNQYKLDKMNIIAGNKYLLIPRKCTLDLFRAENKNYYRQDRITLGWGKIGLNGVHVHDIPGNHFELFSPPNDKILARILQDILDKRYLSLILLFSKICMNF
ncbi:amino acid adenylation domain-containing protein [Flavobacterium galactosidilyticum]|uniref:non-ribosomal peptide synthetase n=1 Tax=Flavobacterium galactosidilyticum TaxID=2893886 RepID=UPI001E4EED93|nr:non-ribosomal peptide synthetase [Flavobacterium sp. F-340]UFH45637.1 amino acid adenylation domain-containing protein [Flavobacterium sp. F-340]